MTDKVTRIGRDDDDQMATIDKRSLQDHRDEAYKNGWNDGYAEGFGKASSGERREPASPRPANCRFRLRDEGMPYPRIGCAAARWRSFLWTVTEPVTKK